VTADEATVLWRWLWARDPDEAEDPGLTRAFAELDRELARLLRPFARGAIITDADVARANRALAKRLWTCQHLAPIERWLRRSGVPLSPMAPSRRGHAFWVKCASAPAREAIDRAVRIPRGVTFKTWPPARFDHGEAGYVCTRCQCGILIE